MDPHLNHLMGLDAHGRPIEHTEGCECRGPISGGFRCPYPPLSQYPAIRALQLSGREQSSRISKAHAKWRAELRAQQEYEADLRAMAELASAPTVQRGEPLGAEGTVYRIVPDTGFPVQPDGSPVHFTFVSGSFDLRHNAYFETTNRSLAAQAREHPWLSVKKLERTPEEVFVNRPPAPRTYNRAEHEKAERLIERMEGITEQLYRLADDGAAENAKKRPRTRTLQDINRRIEALLEEKTRVENELDTAMTIVTITSALDPPKAIDYRKEYRGPSNSGPILALDPDTRVYHLNDGHHLIQGPDSAEVSRDFLEWLARGAGS